MKNTLSRVIHCCSRSASLPYLYDFSSLALSSARVDLWCLHTRINISSSFGGWNALSEFIWIGEREGSVQTGILLLNDDAKCLWTDFEKFISFKFNSVKRLVRKTLTVKLFSLIMSTFGKWQEKKSNWKQRRLGMKNFPNKTKEGIECWSLKSDFIYKAGI